MNLLYSIRSTTFPTAVLPLVLALATGLITTTPARAGSGLVLGIANGVASPGSSTNSFDVTITNTTAGGVDIGGFSFELTTTSADVMFTDVTTASPAYIFANNSYFGPDIVIDAAGNTVSAGDNYGTSNSGITLGAGQTLDLGQVIFTLDTSASTTPIPLVFSAYPATGVNGSDGADYGNTLLGPDNSNAFSITVGAGSVPEPTSLLIGLQGLLFACWVGKRSRVSKTARQ